MKRFTPTLGTECVAPGKLRTVAQMRLNDEGTYTFATDLIAMTHHRDQLKTDRDALLTENDALRTEIQELHGRLQNMFLGGRNV